MVKDRIKKVDISECIVQSEIVLLIVDANLGYWFATAPDIRFVSILLVFVIFETPMIMLEKWMSDLVKLKQSQIVAISVMSAISLLGCSTPIVNTAIYLDSVDNLKHLFSDHQVWQYDSSDMVESIIDGKRVYKVVDHMPTYHELPSIYGASDSYDIHFLGDNIEDGFCIRQ